MPDQVAAAVPLVTFGLAIALTILTTWRSQRLAQIAGRAFAISALLSLALVVFTRIEMGEFDPFILYAALMQTILFGLVAFVAGTLAFAVRALRRRS